MKRLPSKPASEEYKHQQYLIQKSFQNRMAALVITAYVCLFALLLTLFFGSSLWDKFKDRLNGVNCEIYVPDFENGSTVFIECEGETAIIDSGINGHDTELLNHLKLNEIEKIDYFIISELNEEYLNVILNISNSLNIGKIFLPLTEDEALHMQFDDLLFSNSAVYSSAFYGMNLYFDDISFTFYDPESVVIDVKFGEHSFLLCNSDSELEILNLKPNLDTDVLISLNGILPFDEFFECVSPEALVLIDNTVDDIGLLSIYDSPEKIFRTDLNGDIVIKSNEVDLRIECEKQ